MQFAHKSLVCLASLFLALVCFSDTVRAQNGPLASNPPQLTFTTQSGTTPPSQTLTITSSAGPTAVTVSAFSDSKWLSVTPSGGTTPLQLTVTVNPALSTVAKDIGFINVSASGAFLSVLVELDVNVTGPSAVKVDPTSLSFNFPANSTVPVTKPVALTGANPGVTSFTATATTNDGGNWLTVNPASGNLPNTLQVTVNPAQLQGAGPFSAAIAINPPGTAGTKVQVLVTLGGTPAVQFTPGQLNFAWQIGTTAPLAQSVAITSSTGATVSFAVSSKTSSCGNWLVVSPQTGATPSNVTAQINTASLTTAQNCAGEIDITAQGASNPMVAIPVNLLVSTNPLLQVPSTGPSFTYQLGTSTQLAAQNVQITSSSTALSFTTTSAPANAGGPNFLVITPGGGTTPQQLQLSVDPSVLATLAPGTYSETVTVTSPGAGNSPQTFTTTLTVDSNPLLISSVSSLTFNYEIGKTAPTSQTFTLDSSASPLNFQLSTTTDNCSGFLTATANGGSTGLTFGNENQVVAKVTITGLTTPMVCTGHITVSVPNSSTPALSIPVTLNVSDKALLNVSTNSINIVLAEAAAASTQTVAVTSTDSTVLTFAATAVTDPIGLTWLTVAPNTGNTPNNLLIGINPANLGVGTYNGTITVSSTGLPSQVIHVHLVLVASSLSANPASVTLSQALGGSPVSQTVQINGVPSGTTIGALVTMLNGTGWLTATTSANVVTVTADPKNLAQGTYSGVVTVIAPGAGNSPLNIPVTLNVAVTNTFTLSASSVSFSFQAGGVVPTSNTIDLSTSNGVSVPFTATVAPALSTNRPAGSENTPKVAAPANLFTVTPTSGNTPSTLTISVNGSVLNTLAQGTYTANLTISSPNLPGGDQVIQLSLTVSGTASPTITSIVNAASFLAGPISPGELVTIFGSNMGPATGINFTPDNGKVDTTLGNTMVLFNGIPAPVLYASAMQINAIVPYAVASNASVSVTINDNSIVSTVGFTADIADSAPGIFSQNQSGNGQGAILNQNLSGNSTANPAPKGSIVSIYATGEGSLNPPAADGVLSGPSLPLPAPIAKVSVTIGGQPAEVSYAGEAPTLVSGVLQVNAKIPNNIPSGNQLVVLTIGANKNTQQSITVAVQ